MGKPLTSISPSNIVEMRGSNFVGTQTQRIRIPQLQRNHAFVHFFSLRGVNCSSFQFFRFLNLNVFMFFLLAFTFSLFILRLQGAFSASLFQRDQEAKSSAA